MDTYGPEERAQVEGPAARLYEWFLEQGTVDDAHPRLAADSADRPAFDLLVELGLVQHGPTENTWVPEDPATVQARVVSPLSLEGTRLLNESTSWARAFGQLSLSYRRAPKPRASADGVTYVRDLAIGPFLNGLVNDAQTEILTAQPQALRDPQSLATAALRDTEALERGLTLRTLYQHSARRSTATTRYVAEVVARGAEVRTLDEFFNRLIVIDRRVAIIPGAEDLRTAVAVEEPSVVTYLVDVFERTWERARPFTSRDSRVLRDIAAEQRAMTIRMLIEGHADPVSAKRLGVSPRTYAGYVADLKTEYEAETRFQLGYAMGQAGTTGREDDDASED